MRSNVKRKSLCILTAAATLCIGGAVAGLGLNAVSAYADEETTSYYAFVNVGASNDAKQIDSALGLAEKGATAVAAGTVTEGNTLFESYATGASYSFALDAGSYQVAVAVLAESGTAVTVGGQTENVAEEGKQIVSVTASVTDGTPLTVSVTGKLCGVLVAAENSEILMSAEYTAGQVIPYGALLSDVLENATGYFSNGETKEVEIEYGNIVANTGVNVNFTTVDITGTVKGTNLSVSRYVTTMPEDLVYFINCASFNEPSGTYPEESVDASYEYNKTLFDYYKGKGNPLLNDGVPDRTSNNSNNWGCYTKSVVAAPGDSAFPYNTLRWTGASTGESKGVTDMGYYLTGLEAGASYRFYIGSLSHWHARTVNITFNGAAVGAETLRINSSKSYSVFEGVTADSNGKVNLHLQGGSTNEPCICFIAVQKTSTEVSAVPSAPQGPSIIGMTEHSLLITDGIQEGAKLQIYNAARPNQVLFEEMVNADKIVAEGEGYTYELDWGELFSGISQFYVVQITNGGVSEGLHVSITDIEDFAISVDTEAYTTGTVTVSVTAHANSGIASWSYRLGEFGAVNEFALDKPATMLESFTASENGEYIIVVTSGLGVTYSESVTISNIDPDRPVITITPSRAGWESGAYNVTVSVRGVAPVAEYKLYKNGKEIASAESVPATVTFKETGEYLVYVKNAAGRSATNTVCVSENPTVTKVTSSYANRTLKYTFADNSSYTIASVSAYQVTDSRVIRMTIASGNTMDVYDEGTYVVAVTTSNGTVEMFSLNVTEENLSNEKEPVIAGGGGSSGGGNGAALGIGLGVGIGGLALAAAAIAVTFVLMKKKSVKAEVATAETASEEAGEEADGE